MGRFGVLTGSVVVALAVFVSGAGAAERSELQGRWSGTLEPSEGSTAKPEAITVTVNHAETKGSWSISPSCHGKLVLQSISNGYHHYERLVARGVAAGCNTGGVDCLKPEEAGQILDVYVSANGTEDSSGILSRKH